MRKARLFTVLATVAFVVAAFVVPASADSAYVYETTTPPANCTFTTGQLFQNATWIVVIGSDGSCVASIDPQIPGY